MFARMRGMKGEVIDLPEGFRWDKRPSNHVAILCPDGTPLRMRSGIPLTLSLTPSDRRTRKNELARVRQALRARGEEA